MQKEQSIGILLTDHPGTARIISETDASAIGIAEAERPSFMVPLHVGV